MHKSVKFITLCLVAVSLVSVAVFSGVSAQGASMNEEQINRIRTSCVSAKNTLNRLHASDALLRVNRGQIYESMSTKLMARFNSRATSNRFDAKDLLNVARDYGSSLTDFRTDYISYEVQLANALQIDCLKEPVSFYDAVALARTNRAKVHADVVRLHQYIDDYATAFNEFVIEINQNDKANR